ncbi:hypothetical protein SAMN06265379_10468 [Saccharicrinis carchari]|uniref:DUF2269 domain-containing protein n=1 Tax=Saccharicrinis carchari TaxID=1168039 RepID=A0A521CZG6_SACCC|nr:hypothetical protein [Saccharicrinis carchari]SMO64826.1 hypothetical protein SAMN06265379_10468 [Saccharicrinis carchari]
MKQLTLTQRKWLKSFHLITAGFWVTSGSTMLLLHFMLSSVKTGDQLYLMNQIIYFIDMKILVPSAMLCLVTGLLYSQYTKWGYFKHNWITYKWIVTILIIILGTIFSGPWIEEMVKISGEIGLEALDSPEYQKLYLDQALIGFGMNAAIIVAIFFSVFKPKLGKK